MDTISKQKVLTKWGGKFEVYELKQFSDNRGMVCETFRLDETVTEDSKMCYVSETTPYVMRGPHQHENQKDNFISWKTKMVYQMYNPEVDEFEYFITDPSKFYLVVVDTPIIHSYRNISDKISMTMNFPTSLFMGEDKKEEIDEIRWEEKLNKSPVFVILGANGRLGKALTKNLYDNMGFHKWDVIPIGKKFKTDEDVNEAFNNIQNSIDNAENRDIYVINCAAATDVANDSEETVEFVNIKLPISCAKECTRRNWNLVQLSTDYVYQRVDKSAGIYFELSPYAMSKKRMEFELNNLSPEIKDKVYIFRVANLFSKDVKDENNMISKFWKICRRDDCVKVDENIVVFPTDVEHLATSIVEKLNSGFLDDMDVYDYPTNVLKNANFVPEQYWDLKTLLTNYFSPKSVDSRKSNITPWYNSFKDNVEGIVVTFEGSETSIINTIEEYNYIASKNK